MTTTAAIANQHSEPISPRHKVVRKWVASRYPKIDRESLSLGILNKSTLELEALQIAGEINQQRREELETCLQGALAIQPFVDAELIEAIKLEFESLARDAGKTGDEGEMARTFFGLLLMSNGFPLVDELQLWGQQRSSEIFLQLAKSGQFIAEISTHVFTALARTHTLKPAIKQTLLPIFDLIVASQDCPSRESCATTLRDALICEIGRLPCEVDESVAVAILDRIALMPHPDIFPILEALTTTEGLRATRKHARSVLSGMLFSAQKIWDETSADLVSDLEERAKMLERMQTSTLTEVEAARVIVHAFKESEIETDSDPRINRLNSAFNHDATPVRLTASLAAVVQAESGSLSNATSVLEEVMQNSCKSLATIAVSSSNPQARHEAILLLARMEKVSPLLESIVARQKEQASIMFLSQQTQN